MTIVQVY